jgi:hypothetical protein
MERGALLERLGYQGLDGLELGGLYRAISSSTSGPKGVVLRGQIDSVTVERAETRYGEEVDTGRPPNSWVGPTEPPGCASLR